MPRGPKPKPAALARPGSRVHEYRNAPGTGWQHGATPPAPGGLTSVGVQAWNTWMTSWWAAFWEPADLPGLELTVELYDRVRLGELTPDKLTPYLDRFGITAKGRQDNRWAEPVVERPAASVPVSDDLVARRAGRRSSVA